MIDIEKIKENLLENAKLAIQLGIEDFDLSANDEKRKISAIRNSVAGLLLLYKYKLLLESQLTEDPYKYIRKKNSDNNNLGLPKQTVTVHEIKNNFNSLNLEIPDIKYLDNIIIIRNEIEHFYQVTKNDILSLLVKVYYLIEKFYNKYLVIPHGCFEEFVTEEIYQRILNNKQIYVNKLQDCINSFNEVDFPSYAVKDILLENQKCPNCKSELIKAQNKNYENLNLMCSYCLDKNLDTYDVLGLTHRELIRGEDYRCECPECDDFNVIYGVCFSCGYELEEDRDYQREAYLQYLMDKND